MKEIQTVKDDNSEDSFCKTYIFVIIPAIVGLIEYLVDEAILHFYGPFIKSGVFPKLNDMLFTIKTAAQGTALISLIFSYQRKVNNCWQICLSHSIFSLMHGGIIFVAIQIIILCQGVNLIALSIDYSKKSKFADEDASYVVEQTIKNTEYYCYGLIVLSAISLLVIIYSFIDYIMFYFKNKKNNKAFLNEEKKSLLEQTY